MRPSRHHSSRRAAFSLFEIVVAMTILGIISSAVLSILWQAGDTAAGIRELDQRDEEVSRFLALLRESIENLPPGGTLAMTPAEESVSGYPELVIGNSATAFTFGEIVGSSEETILSLRPGKEPPGGGAPAFALALSRADFAPEDTDGSGMAFRAGPDDFLQSDEEGRYWLPLLSGVTAASWHFWDEEQQEWIDEWTDEEKMPPLLAFSFDDNFRPVPLRVVFTVPEQVASPPAETTTATSSGATTTNRSSGGGSRAGSDGGGGDGGARSDGNQRRSGGGEARPNRGGDRPGGGAGESGSGNNNSGGRGGGNRGGGPGGGGGR